jgi:integrase
MAQRRGHNEGSVYRDRARGCWYGAVSLRDDTGRRRQVRTPAKRTRAEAVAALRDLSRRADTGDDLRHDRLTVADAVADYCTRGIPTGLAESSAYGRRLYAEAFGAGCGRHRLRGLTVRHVEDWLASRAGDWSPRTLRLARSAADAVLTHAARHGWLPPERNVATLARLPQAAPRPRRDVLDVAAVRTLLYAADGDWWAPLLATVAVTGCRIGEAAGLAWSDVDTDRNVITIRQAVRVAPDGSVSIAAPKARSGRAVQVPPALVDRLRAHRRTVAEHALGLGRPAPDLAVPTRMLTPADPHDLRRWLRALGRRAGVPVTGFHQFRHRLASALADAGAQPVHVAAQLGHATPNTTLGVYTHPVRPVADAAVAEGTALLTVGVVAGHQGST